ncbi:TrkA family potassium uptake protein [soil metagenome]
MKLRFAVIGLGRFGTAVARTLAEKGAEVIAIDSEEEAVNFIADQVALAVTMDASDIKALRSHNIDEMDAAIVAIGTNFESELMVTTNLMELGVPRIIARAQTQTQRAILTKIGIKEIISPETEVGINLAERLMSPGIKSYLQLPDEYEIVEVDVPQNCGMRTLADINLRKKYNINLIALRRKEIKNVNGEKVTEEHLIGVPSPDLKLLPGDVMLIIGKGKDVNRFIEVNQR